MIPKFDKKNFATKAHQIKILKPWGYEIHWAESNLPYMGKIIHIDAGKRLSLQIHDVKQETQMLINGECNLIQEDSEGTLQTIPMEKSKGYTVVVGQKHRLHAVTDCDVIEVSTQELGTTWRLEDDYKRPDETEELRKQKNRGWA